MRATMRIAEPVSSKVGQGDRSREFVWLGVISDVVPLFLSMTQHISDLSLQQAKDLTLNHNHTFTPTLAVFLTRRFLTTSCL